jgi:hypothetical protein
LLALRVREINGMKIISRSHMVTQIMEHIPLIVMDKFSLVQEDKDLDYYSFVQHKRDIDGVVSIIFKDWNNIIG